MRDIIDIKEVFLTLSPKMLIFFISLGAFCLLLVLFFIYRKIRKRTSAKRLPPNKIFFNELVKIKKEQPDIKKLFFGLSSILKKYLENRFQIQAKEKTTEELKKDLQIPEIPQVWKEKLISTFKNFDEVWFSGKTATKEEVIAFEKLATDFVLQTTPK